MSKYHDLIRKNYPHLSENLVPRLIPSVFELMKEKNFPVDADDIYFHAWYAKNGLPIIESLGYRHKDPSDDP